MKKQLLLGLSFVFVLAACDSSSENGGDNAEGNQQGEEKYEDTKEMIEDALQDINEQDKIFDVKAGKITYEYSGNWTGTETAWFDQYGRRVVIEQDVHYSAKNHSKNIQIWVGEKEGSMVCKYLDYGMEVNECQPMILRTKDSELSLFAHGDETQLKYGYDKVGSETVAGKKAIGWKSKSAEITGWVWKGIDLKYDNMGVKKVATSFEEISEIPADKFKAPEGFKTN